MKTPTTFHPSSILCPVDFSELSDLALKYAAAGARAFDATLVVFHAARFELPAYFTGAQAESLKRQHQSEQKQVKEFLRLYARRILGGEASRIRLKFETADAHPVDAVLAAARKSTADLIVMGTHGRGGAKRLWLGSVAENVVRQADVPVFIVRQKQYEFINASDPKAIPRIVTILCPVNFTEASRSALRHAISIAQQFKAQLITPCIIEPDDKRSFAEAKQELAAWMNETAAGTCDAQIVTKRGQAAERIVSLVTATRADLVVMGAQHRSSLRNWFSGDTTEFVLRHASSPVLIVPH